MIENIARGLEQEAASAAPASEAPAATQPRRRGRPRGTGYLHLDAPLHEQMREMLKQGLANSRTAAAKRLADRAYGTGTWEAKIRRLVRSFQY
jgi:hypothetical protein